jgi:hypothetical protein
VVEDGLDDRKGDTGMRVMNEKPLAERIADLASKMIIRIYTNPVVFGIDRKNFIPLIESMIFEQYPSYDLIESRELVEKQKELIKEMRGLIKDIYVSGLSTSRNCAIDKLLERTKEYT